MEFVLRIFSTQNVAMRSVAPDYFEADGTKIPTPSAAEKS